MRCMQCGTTDGRRNISPVSVHHRRDGSRCEQVMLPAYACGNCSHDLIDGGPYKCLCGRVVEIRLDKGVMR